MPRQYLKFFLFILVVFLISFILINSADIKILADPSDKLYGGGYTAALTSILLLTSDIILPIPSSIIMIANGAVFGIITGTLISLAGTLASSLIGFLIGRKGLKFINKLINEKEQQQADKLIKRWGIVIIIITRPIPLLSETVSIMAGTSKISFLKITAASIAGLLPPSIIYALSGIYAVDFESGAITFLAVFFFAAAFWFISRLIENKLTNKAEV